MGIKQKNLRFWGHNCFSIESKKSILLIDPWFSERGAFFGSWYQYPRNHHLKKTVLDLLTDYNNSFIFISHEHQDHYDHDFLKLIPEKTKILIPEYVDKEFRNNLLNLERDVIELSDFEKFNLLPDLQIYLLISDIGINHDSAIFVKTEEFSFLNQNDCKVFERLNEIEDSVDFYSVQFSGATWHPSCFAYSDSRKKIISKQKVNNKLNNVLKGLEQLRPRFFLPAAGPAVFPFLDIDLSLGQENIFIHQKELKEFLEENGYNNSLFLKPGDYLNSNLTMPIPNPKEKDIREYKKQISNSWLQLPDKLNRKLLENSISERLSLMDNVDIEKCPVLVFNFSGNFNDQDHTSEYKIFIDLNNKSIIDDFDYSSHYEEIVASKRYFNLMCFEGWQNVYLSLRAQVVRNPDIFNNDLNIFLFSDTNNIKENYIRTRSIRNERITILDVNGHEYEINRFCPHQGADLKDAEIVSDNYLICPRHGWKFDLNRNGICKSSGETINAVRK